MLSVYRKINIVIICHTAQNGELVITLSEGMPNNKWHFSDYKVHGHILYEVIDTAIKVWSTGKRVEQIEPQKSGPLAFDWLMKGIALFCVADLANARKYSIDISFISSLATYRRTSQICYPSIRQRRVSVVLFRNFRLEI